MTRSNAQTTRSTRAAGRKRLRPRPADPSWYRPFCRAHHALHATLRLIESTRSTVARSQQCVQRRPLLTARILDDASATLLDASARLARAAAQIAETDQCLAREPDPMDVVPALLDRAAEHYVLVAGRLQEAANDVFALQEDVQHGLETGSLVPEQTAERRPRIRLAPRPTPLRAFLLLRQPRVVDRIAPILRRRRRTPLPASVRVPQRSLLGRAPPLFSIAPL